MIILLFRQVFKRPINLWTLTFYFINFFLTSSYKRDMANFVCNSVAFTGAYTNVPNSETAAKSDVEAILWRHNTSNIAEKNLMEHVAPSLLQFWHRSTCYEVTEASCGKAESAFVFISKNIHKAKKWHEVFVRTRRQVATVKGFHSVFCQPRLRCSIRLNFFFVGVLQWKLA